MKPPPVILVTPDTEVKGVEMADVSSSLSENYQRALLAVGAVPVTLAATTERAAIAESLRRCDGVLLTGGEDLHPDLYAPALAPRLKALATLTPDQGARDLRELILVDEAFRQRKPLLAICRGQQVLNVALGGTLWVDLPTQFQPAINHRQMDKKCEIVHEVHLTPNSLLAKISGTCRLGVNSTHHQAVDKPAAVLEVVARSPDGVVEGLQLKATAARMLPFLLSVQFHPERLLARHPEHRAIFTAFARACSSNRKIKI